MWATWVSASQEQFFRRGSEAAAGTERNGKGIWAEHQQRLLQLLSLNPCVAAIIPEGSACPNRLKKENRTWHLQCRWVHLPFTELVVEGL